MAPFRHKTVQSGLQRHRNAYKNETLKNRNIAFSRGSVSPCPLLGMGWDISVCLFGGEHRGRRGDEEEAKRDATNERKWKQMKTLKV